MIRNIFVWVCSAFGLLACAQNTGYYPPDALPPPNLLSDSAPVAPVTVRVIVQFRQPEAYSDAAFLKTLQEHIQAPVRYIAAVSGDTHVYSLQLPANQNPASALQRLSTLPSVARAEIDSKAKAP